MFWPRGMLPFIFNLPMASVVTEFVCVCVFIFLPIYKSTLFLITEHGGKGEAVELIVMGEEGNLKEQLRKK